MKDFKHLLYNDYPCWYELSFIKKEIAILLRLHKDLIIGLDCFSNENWLVEKFIKEFKFDSFYGTFDNERFGFEGVFRNIGEKDGFVEFIIKIPKPINSNKKCEYCEGKGKKPKFMGEGDCFSCQGTGKKVEYNWHASRAISASFSILSPCLCYPPKEDTSASFPQLIALQTVTLHEQHGGSLGGIFSSAFSKWLYLFEENYIFHEAKEAMMATYAEMRGGLREFDEHYFHAHIMDKGRVTLYVPGDACGVYVNGMSRREEGEAREFECHNVDTPHQQISLIAGLAALHDQARREIAQPK